MMIMWAQFVHAQTVDKPSEVLPVTKVVLYKHGLGYLEREGPVDGNQLLTFSFREDQMKDILTSFFAVDLGKGKISSIRYDTRDPLSRQLQDVTVKVPGEAALSQFMLQLRGANIRLKASGESIEGRVLGTEPINEVFNKESIKKGYRLVLLTADSQVKSVDLYAISEFSLADESLQKELSRFLDLTLDSKRHDRKNLTVSAAGEGRRTLRVGYLTGMPIWKCAYRVIFDGSKKDNAALIQGWALAENNTEDDWKDIKIAFVAGNPISYVMDLYSPYYVKRAQVQIPGFRDIGVDWSKMTSPDLSEPTTKPPAKREKRIGPGGGAGRRTFGAQTKDQLTQMPLPAPQRTVGHASEEEKTSLGDILASSYDPQTQGLKVGELFSYEPKDKITIPRGQAAMVSILAEKVGGKRVLFYKADFSPRPLNAFVLQNGTELTLDAGPVTFFESSASLGEGILTSTLAPGSQEVVPYAVDVTVDVVSQEKSRREPLVRARLVDGVLTMTSAEILTNSWKITNRGKESATLWLHQPRAEGYRLHKPEKPLKEVDRHYRFEIPLRAAETVDFVVEEKRDISETAHLAKCSEEQIRFYISQPSLSKGAKAFLSQVGDLMAMKASLHRQISELTQQSRRLTDEQARIRSNLQALTSNQPKELELRSKWVVALSDNENQLSDCRSKLDEAGAKVLKMDESLAKKIKEYKDE